MTTPLESILPGAGERSPAPATTEPQAPQTEAPAETTTDPSVTTEQGQAMVPKAALDEARGKAKRYTEQIASFEQTLKERDAAMERRFSQFMETVRPQQRAEPPDFFADQEAAMGHYLRPVLQRIEGMSEAMSRQFAVRDHGRETVEQAYSVLSQRIGTDPAAQGEYQRIMRSGDPWGELVKWHKREAAIAEIGTDPDAYKAKVEAEILAKHGVVKEQQNGAAQPAPPVMPSNFAAARNVASRSGPAWGGPQPAESIFATNRAARGVR